MYTYDVVDCVEHTSNIVFNSKRMTISRGGGKKSVDRKGHSVKVVHCYLLTEHVDGRSGSYIGGDIRDK